MTIRTDSPSGSALTRTVTLPHNRWWDLVEVNTSEPGGSTVRFSVIDAYNGKVVFDHENYTASPANVSNIFPRNTDRLRLELWLQGDAGDFPEVHWWRISWVPDLPERSQSIPEIDMLEDVPRERFLRLSNYFHDYYTIRPNLTFEVSYVSDADHILPNLTGQLLSVDLPTENWNGAEVMRVLCSDGEFSVESEDIVVNVAPVDDPPEVDLPDLHEVTEEQESELDVSRFLSDVDTPVGDLTETEDGANTTVRGQSLVFNYSVGYVSDDVRVWVSDGTSVVNATLHVYVRNVNDPPRVVHDVSRQFATEEEPLTVHLDNALWDEDHEVGDLSVSCEDPHVTSVEGRSITLLHREWVDLRTVVFTVTDGEASAVGSFQVQVEAVNDPPVIGSVGTHSAMEPIEITIDEGSDVWLEISVEDPDSGELDYTALFDWDGVMAHVNGTLHITAVQGDADEYEGRLVVDDGDGGSAEGPITVVVADVNDPPRFLDPLPATVEVLEGEEFAPQLEAWDLEGDDVTWSDDTELFDVDPVTGALSFTPGQEHVGDHQVTVSIDDGRGGEARMGFTLTVVNVNDAPVIVSVSPENGSRFKEGKRVVFEALATDEDGDELTYEWFDGEKSIGTGPTLTYNRLSGGKHIIFLKITDGEEIITHSFIIQIKKVNSSPYLDSSWIFSALILLALYYIIRK